MKLYSIFDKKAAIYGAIMMAPNDALMVRTIDEQVKGSGNTVARYPEDFDLFEVGEFDDCTGRVAEPANPRFVVNMATVLVEKGRA